MSTALDLTLVIDIGKSQAKLLFIDDAGEVAERHSRANRSVVSALGYRALDIAGLTQWMCKTLAASSATQRCARAIASTHGAAFVALGDDGLAWDPLDYEFEGVAETRIAYQLERDDFAATLAPDLPDGLNAARQLYWLQQRHPLAWARTRCLLPYPQYWAWWLSGVAASEVSSLGCHTQLWRPRERRFSDLARRQAWADLFAPVLPAWQMLGSVRAELTSQLGLPASCEVHVGVHDSNACLARYLGDADDDKPGMSLVSTGTWVVVMAPGASAQALDPARDMLANVSVRGDVVPTARFMGGRELEAICAGAPHELASSVALVELMVRDVQAWPSFARTGGPLLAPTGANFSSREGRVTERGTELDIRAALAPAQRASLGALYGAQVTALLLQRLGSSEAIVLEGPFASNAVYAQSLAALRPDQAVFVSTDPVEGTARGAWRLARWQVPKRLPSRLQRVEVAKDGALLQDHHRRWLHGLR